jgi:hypothetical protein
VMCMVRLLLDARHHPLELRPCQVGFRHRIGRITNLTRSTPVPTIAATQRVTQYADMEVLHDDSP